VSGPADWIASHPRRVLALVLAVSAAALWPASRLRLETDLPSLLPRGAPAAAAYRDFLTTFGGFEKVFVIVRAAGGPRGSSEVVDAGTLTDAAGRLAEELAKDPEVASARAGLTPEDEEFFFRWIAPRAPLLLPAGADPSRLRAELARRLDPEEIRRRVGVLRGTLTSPAGGFAAPFLAADPLGFSEGLLAAAGASLPLDPVSGAFVSRRGDAALVLVTPARAELDPAGGRALAAALARAEAAVAREEAGSGGARLDFAALGGPIYAAHDERIIREDLARISLSSVVVVGILLLLGFEGLYVPLALFAVAAVGLLWAAAIAGLWLGSVTVVGIGFIATLLGMGVDYGIHGGARFRLLHLAGESRRAALVGSLRQTGPAILAATLTTAAALAALSFAHFRPLRELGQVLAIGILSMLAATTTLGAALAAFFPRGRLLGGATLLWRRLWMPGFEALVRFARRRPRAVLAGALLVSLAAAAGLPRLSLDSDLRTLRPADAESGRAERLLVERFGLGLDTTTIVVRGASLAAALDRAAAVRLAIASSPGFGEGSGAEITTPSDWRLGGRRTAERLRLLAGLPFDRAAGDLERELGRAGLRVERFAGAIAALRALGRGEDPGAPPPAAWPSWMSELVRREARGGWAVAVHVRAPAGVWPSGPPAATLAAIEAAGGKPANRVSVASAPRVGAELRDLALRDLFRLSVVAAGLAAAVLAVAFWRRPGEALLAALPLALGFLWTFGAWGLAGRRIDLLCIATLPVLVGTGVDLGVYAVYRADRLPGGIAGSVKRSGVALTLAALTTTAGFGSLDSSRVPGLANAGVIVALGVVLCLVASLFVLPAIEALGQRSRADRAAAGTPLPARPATPQPEETAG
jgi:predicted RND superfamily exporter protein